MISRILFAPFRLLRIYWHLYQMPRGMVTIVWGTSEDGTQWSIAVPKDSLHYVDSLDEEDGILTVEIPLAVPPRDELTFQYDDGEEIQMYPEGTDTVIKPCGGDLEISETEEKGS